MRKVRLTQLLVAVTFGASALVEAVPVLAQPRPLATVSGYCLAAREEFTTRPLILRLDELSTPFAAGVTAIDDLRSSISRVGATAPTDIAPYYRSGVGALKSLRTAWKTMKTSRSEPRKSNARILFVNSTASFTALATELLDHVAGACRTVAPSSVATTVIPTPTTAPLTTLPPTTLPPAATVPTMPTMPTTIPRATTPPAPPTIVTLPTIPNLIPLIVIIPPTVPFTIPSTIATPTLPTIPPTLATIPAPPPPVTGDAVVWLAMVNQARGQARSCGATAFAAAPPLTSDARLDEAARVQSSYQDSISTMTHTGAGGSNAGQRMTAAGFIWSTWGENVGWNYPGATAMLQGWINSPGHCANIMEPAFTHIGWTRVGAYDTMVLGRPR